MKKKTDVKISNQKNIMKTDVQGKKFYKKEKQNFSNKSTPSVSESVKQKRKEVDTYMLNSLVSMGAADSCWVILSG